MTNNTDELDKQLNNLADEWRCWAHGQLDGTPFLLDELNEIEDTVTEAKRAIIDWHNKQEATLLDALYWMYSQYCSGGHDFMGAGEDASKLLENAGYITTDGAGRIIKDNGDSTEQRNKLKESSNG